MSLEIPAWEPLSPEVLADQRAAYDRQRAACPLARSPRGVTLLRHADVVAAASDPQAATGHQVLTVHVRSANAPPEITSVAVTGGATGAAYRYVARATDDDGDPLTWDLTGPAGMAIDPTSGVITWTPQLADQGTHPIVVEVAS